MRSLCLIALLGLAALLLVVAPVQAQFYPQFPFGAMPVPYRTYNAGYANGQMFTIARYGYIYPGSGYTWGYSSAYTPGYGVTTGYYNGNANPFYSSYQFYPTYVPPAYYYQQATTPTTGYVKTPSYSYPSYYVPTY
jgi:hypothetical protein